MTDPLEALRLPYSPLDPDPAFAAGLRARLRRALLDPTGDPMTTDAVTSPGPRTFSPLTPYLAVHDGRAALEWYVAVFGAVRVAEPVVMDDGRIGHAEVSIEGALLMLAEEFPEYGITGPRSLGGASQSNRLQVEDPVATVSRAVEAGARLHQPVADQGHGLSGAVIDPFGHRWIVAARDPVAAPEQRQGQGHGDIGYATLAVPDAGRAKAFYGSVLGWTFTAGSVEQGWQVPGTEPPVGLWGGSEQAAVQLCYRVADIGAALRAVLAAGGTAGTAEPRLYGRMADCTDDQGTVFQLWQPAD